MPNQVPYSLGNRLISIPLHGSVTPTHKKKKIFLTDMPILRMKVLFLRGSNVRRKERKTEKILFSMTS